MLILPIKEERLRKIEAGKQKEDYRAFTPFHHVRFGRFRDQQMQVIFMTGRNKDAPALLCEITPSVRRGGKPSWGADPRTLYWVLTIHRVIERRGEW